MLTVTESLFVDHIQHRTTEETINFLRRSFNLRIRGDEKALNYLDIAIRCGRMDTYRALVATGKFVLEEDDHIAFSAAAGSGNAELMTELEKLNPTLSAYDTALQKAAMNGQHHIIDELMTRRDAGIAYLGDKYATHAFVHACWQDRFDIARKLLPFTDIEKAREEIMSDSEPKGVAVFNAVTQAETLMGKHLTGQKRHHGTL